MKKYINFFKFNLKTQKNINSYEIIMDEKMIEPSLFMKSEANTTVKNLSFNNASPIPKSEQDAITTKMESDSDFKNSQAYINAMKALQKKIKNLESLLAEGQKRTDKQVEEKSTVVTNLSQKLEENSKIFQTLELNLKTKLSFFEKDNNELKKKNESLSQENDRLKLSLEEINAVYQSNLQIDNINNFNTKIAKLEQLNKKLTHELELSQKEKQKYLLQLNELQEKLSQKENDQFNRKNKYINFGYDHQDPSSNEQENFFSIKKELDAQIEINRQQKLLLSEKFREIEFLRGSSQASSFSNLEVMNKKEEISFNENMNPPMQYKKIANENLTERNNVNQYKLIAREGNSKINVENKEKLNEHSCEVNESLKYLLTNDSFSLKAADCKRRGSLGSFENSQKIINLEKELVKLNKKHQDLAEELIVYLFNSFSYDKNF